MNSLNSPIFIGGMMKSGTSLLRVLLGKHPNIFASYETHWFDLHLHQNGGSEPAPREKWLRELYDVPECDFEQLKLDATSAEDFLDRFMTYCTRRAGKRRWVEKTPDNIRHLSRIWDFWPDAKVIHVRRDLRDIFASWKKNKKGTLAQFLQIAKTTYQEIGELLGTETRRYREVSYECLVRQTRSAMQAVLDFVGEAWAPGMDRNDTANFEYERVKAVVGVHSATAISLKKPIFTDSVGQWRKMLTQTEAAQIETQLRPFWMAPEETVAL